MKMKCINCSLLNEDPKIEIEPWKKGDDGLRFKWNKLGEEKVKFFVCSKCSYKNEFSNL